MITRGADIITDTSVYSGSYGPTVNTRTHKIVLEGGHQPPNHTYTEFTANEPFSNYCLPKTRTATTALIPWARTQETRRVIYAVTASNAVLYAEYMSTPPTAVDGFWNDGVVSIYNLIADGVDWPLDEHHAFFSVSASDLGLPSWACSKNIAHFIPGYTGSGAQLISDEEPTDARAVAFPHRCPYTIGYTPFGGHATKFANLSPNVSRYNIGLSDGAIYAPYLNTNGTAGNVGPMWWGIPDARLQAYGVTLGNISGSGIPGSYTVTLKGEDRDGVLTTLQTWTGSIPVVQYDSTNDRSAIGLDITLSPSYILPDDKYVIYSYTSNINSGSIGHYSRLHVPHTPALHPGQTNPSVTGDFIPVGWMMKVRPAI